MGVVGDKGWWESRGWDDGRWWGQRGMGVGAVESRGGVVRV